MVSKPNINGLRDPILKQTITDYHERLDNRGKTDAEIEKERLADIEDK